MEVDPRKEGYFMEYEGQAYYFCSASCKERFERNPAAYTKVRSMDHSGGDHEGHFGGCCGIGMGRGWMGYIHLAIMIVFLLLLLLSR